MKTAKTPKLVLAMAAGLLAAPLAAQTAPAPSGESAAANDRFAQFVPNESGVPTQVDYSIWTDALRNMVLWMGPSTRQGASRPNPGTGTRRVYGHESRYRLEGNRVAFSLLNEEFVSTFAEYRADLERIGSEIDIASLPRNEQLAYWLNLHNVAVIEQIARHYPVTSPRRIELGETGTPLDSTPFITVSGVAMSPRDIRTRIVFPNWSDPKVIYGFFRGEVGGPSILREAFTGDNVSIELDQAANEFVNSLRGVEKQGSALMVSEIYREAAPFYFPEMGSGLRAHLARFAEEDVKDILVRTDETRTNQYVDDIADLAAGDREPIYNTIWNGDDAQGTRITQSIARLMNERYEKYKTLREQGRTGRVIILPGSSAQQTALDKEVD